MQSVADKVKIISFEAIILYYFSSKKGLKWWHQYIQQFQCKTSRKVFLEHFVLFPIVMKLLLWFKFFKCWLSKIQVSFCSVNCWSGKYSASNFFLWTFYFSNLLGTRFKKIPSVGGSLGRRRGGTYGLLAPGLWCN